MSRYFLAAYLLFAVCAGALIWQIETRELPSSTETTQVERFVPAIIQKIDEEEATLRTLEKPPHIVTAGLGGSSFTAAPPDYRVGDKVTLYAVADPETGAENYDIADYYHIDGLLIVLILFSIGVIVFARRQGLSSLTSVALSLVFFYFFLLRNVGTGGSLFGGALLFVLATTILTIPLIHGFSRKSLSILAAVTLGYVLSFALAALLAWLIALGPTPSEEFRMLAIQNTTLPLSDIVLVGLFLGAMGALIDVAVTVASAIFENAASHTHRSFVQLYRLGVNVGKDILGSMVNTILLAYLAASLPLFLLIGTQNLAFAEFVNYDFIALELTRTLLGGISMTAVIPLSAAIAAVMTQKKVTD